MDYDGRQIKWYWLFFFIIYCSGVIYLMFKGNPYLYSHNELRSAMSRGETMNLLTIPSQPSGTDKAGAVTFFERYNFSRTGVDPLGSPRSKNYEEYQQFPVEHGVDGFEVQGVASDDSGFYLTGKSPWVISVGLDGQLRWKFKVKEIKDEKQMPSLILDEHTAYIIHPLGEVIAVNKADGSLRWLTNLDREVIAAPFIWQSYLVIPVKGTTASEWLMVKRMDGRPNDKAVKLDIKPGFQVSQGPGPKSLIVTADNKLMALDADDWKIDWTVSFPDPILGPAAVVEHAIFVTTLGSKVIRIDASKKGKVDWELDLEKPPASTLTFVPVANRVALQLTDGQIVMIDAKLGKVLWTYNTLNKSPLKDVWAVRLSAKHIEEYKMDWLHKGWTLWSACSNRHFCIFTPNKGQLVTSTPLSALPLTLPLQKDKQWIFFTEGKEGKYSILHLLESAEIKRLKAEAAKANQ